MVVNKITFPSLGLPGDSREHPPTVRWEHSSVDDGRLGDDRRAALSSFCFVNILWPSPLPHSSQLLSFMSSITTDGRAGKAPTSDATLILKEEADTDETETPLSCCEQQHQATPSPFEVPVIITGIAPDRERAYSIGTGFGGHVWHCNEPARNGTTTEHRQGPHSPNDVKRVRPEESTAKTLPLTGATAKSVAGDLASALLSARPASPEDHNNKAYVTAPLFSSH